MTRKTTKPKPHQWQRQTRNSTPQFMRSRERMLWVSTAYARIPGVAGFVKTGPGQTAVRKTARKEHV